MSVRALVDAIRALAPDVVARFDGQAPPGAPIPRLILNQSAPDIDSRSDAGTPQGMVGRVLLLAVGHTENNVVWVLDRVLPAFEGARPVVAGWSVSPLRQIGPAPIYADYDVTLDTGHPMVGRATFEYAVTRSPEETP